MYGRLYCILPMTEAALAFARILHGPPAQASLGTQELPSGARPMTHGVQCELDCPRDRSVLGAREARGNDDEAEDQMGSMP